MRSLPLLLAVLIAACRAAGSSPAGDTAAVGTAVGTDTTATLPDEPTGEVERGREAVVRFQCGRCHEATGLTPAPLTSHCVRCHKKVMTAGFDAKPKASEWKQHVAHLAAMPSLRGAGTRLRYDWLVGYLVLPHDLRPALMQDMPRLAITREEARDVVTYLASLDAPAAPARETLEDSDPARGRKLVDDMQCGSCHRMSGVPTLAAGTPLGPEAPATYRRSSEELRPAVMLAPDLRFTRDRMTAAQLVQWLADPAAIKSDTLMPNPGLTPSQARDVAAYLLRTPLGPGRARTVPARLPNLERRVGYDEVAREVFDVTCRHCHGKPDDAVGDGGPGNTGGFGFKRRGVNLTSYEEIQGGYLDDKGNRHSLFEPLADGTPRLVATLWARHDEGAGHPNPNLRGMPLGFPPLSAEQIQLVATWVAQGRPRSAP